MRITLTVVCTAFLVCAFAQKKPVILHTNIRGFRMTLPGDLPTTVRTWTIVPEVKPDIFVTAEKQVKFIADVDSVVIKVDKKHPIFDFVVLYQHKDSCFTRVQYAEPPNHLGTLKQGKKYDFSDHKSVPEFTYQDMNHPDLVALRKKYNLDSIAGQAGEINQLLNLMHWMHNLIKHDGQHDNPTDKNADEMIQVCKDGSRGLNCRGLAISLNECYLAMGFQSRYLTCMPKELEFDDCHVINMVYSKELNKWIYLDPTNDAYIMDEKGILLSIEEVRERLINGKPLLLNPGANWNNREACLPESYIYYYMAKNLYRLECPVASEYNYETRIRDKQTTYIELLPLDGINQTPQKTKKTINDLNFTVTMYVTNNPNLFWKAPVTK